MSFHQFSESAVKSKLESLIPPYVFLETSSFDRENNCSFLFNDFKDILVFNSQDNTEVFFQRVENYINKGYWICGYFSYEFGYYLDPALYHLKRESNSPLVWLGVCRKPLKIRHSKKNNYPRKINREFRKYYKIDKMKADTSFKEYSQKIREIKRYLRAGYTYQVNYTFKIKFNFSGNVVDFYLDLRQQQPTSYTAVINTGNNCVLSFSPELFFKSNAKKIISRPMKGTIQKSLFPEFDKLLCQKMKTSLKIKAENLMIVDLLRNDLGRIADKVKVSKLFNIESHKTLHQMTSTIKADIKQKLQVKNIFSALFPCGSVTGAPKIKTMEIIRNLEKEPREVYTGAIGYISPSRKMCFSVAIRTIDICGKRGQLGIGGGIVYDSSSRQEYQEAFLKSRFFTKKIRKVSLIETILLGNSKRYFFLDLHLKRLKESAKYFSIPLDIQIIKEQLKFPDLIPVGSYSLLQQSRSHFSCVPKTHHSKILAKNLIEYQMNNLRWKTDGRFKVRIIINSAGRVKISKVPLEKTIVSARIRLSTKRVNPENCFLYHKTDHRGIYEREREKANHQGCFDVLFMNIHNELTEGAVSNLFILKGKQLWTPDVKCGLLPGVFRTHLINQGRAREKVLKLIDLVSADEVYIGNSVRGLIKVRIDNFCQLKKNINQRINN